jgi:hypothetical protein
MGVFYYRKGGKGLQVGSLPGGVEVPHVRKKSVGKDFILCHFYIILKLEVEKKIYVTPNSQ